MQNSNTEKLCLEVSNIDMAFDAASKEWGLPREQLRAEVVGSERGFLGIFGNKLRVEVRPVRPLMLLKGLTFLNDVLSLMGIDASAEADGDDVIEIGGPDASEYVVGRAGDCLKSLEYILNLSFRRPGVDPRVRLDSSGYRERRARSLERLAEATARQVVVSGRPARLEPMLSWERWVIHDALKDRDDVRTESIGDPPFRKVVVMPRYDERQSRGNRRPRRRS